MKKTLRAFGLYVQLALIVCGCFGAFLYLCRNSVQEPFPQPDWPALALQIQQLGRQLRPLRCLLPPGPNLALELWAYFQ